VPKDGASELLAAAGGSCCVRGLCLKTPGGSRGSCCARGRARAAGSPNGTHARRAATGGAPPGRAGPGTPEQSRPSSLWNEPGASLPCLPSLNPPPLPPPLPPWGRRSERDRPRSPERVSSRGLCSALLLGTPTPPRSRRHHSKPPGLGTPPLTPAAPPSLPPPGAPPGARVPGLGATWRCCRGAAPVVAAWVREGAGNWVLAAPDACRAQPLLKPPGVPPAPLPA